MVSPIRWGGETEARDKAGTGAELFVRTHIRVHVCGSMHVHAHVHARAWCVCAPSSGGQHIYQALSCTLSTAAFQASSAVPQPRSTSLQCSASTSLHYFWVQNIKYIILTENYRSQSNTSSVYLYNQINRILVAFSKRTQYSKNETTYPPR